ncbi:MAG: tRNA uridine-5-carboxymethylaminomethyl(34) synthesis GTPase MnmE [Pseudomonadota bacterium]
MSGLEHRDDTIVATATPSGSGGIGIVRLSGRDAANIAAGIVGAMPAPRMATLRTFRDANQQRIDSGIVLYFPAPESFTGEDVVELQGHGGAMPMQMIVDSCVVGGARLAEPGEFSERAFLNDRIDLAQAEAITDLIASGTEQAARAALRSLSGEFSAQVMSVADQVERIRIYVEAAIDFPEEEVDFLGDAELMSMIDAANSAFDALLKVTTAGRVLRDGFRVVIVGKPNAGKSSLMNTLSGEDTAIVTEVAGTTRDILREHIDVNGLLVELVDTAGLRNDPDQIEAEGIRRARKALASANAVMWVQDSTESHTPEQFDEAVPDTAPVMVVRNKIDTSGDAAGRDNSKPQQVNVSAKTGAGIDALKALLADVAGHQSAGRGAVTARRRHVEALERAVQHFRAGSVTKDKVVDGEVFAEELRLAHLALGEIVGATSSDDLLGKIFADFCIGK